MAGSLGGLLYIKVHACLAAYTNEYSEKKSDYCVYHY